MKTTEEHYNAKFQKEITVVSKHTVLELMESYAKERAIEFGTEIATDRLGDSIPAKIIEGFYDEFINKK